MKRIYRFIMQTFLPLFMMTFFICLFIILMQFLWKYVDDLVGKGLDTKLVLELFLYAALSLIPMALPLSILLASLMTFGNLGERLELLAIKAAGISLIRIMRPIIFFLVFIAFGAFFFQNNVLPYAQVKMYSLLFSMRQKSPELDIPEGVFYDQIAGYNLYVEHKDKATGMLHDVMIYDLSKGFDDAMVIVADSGKIKFSHDKQNLLLTLHQGESFENLKGQRTNTQNVPYRRETFSKKEILIPFDANFNRMDEGVIQNQYVGKDLKMLTSSIDSMTYRTDSIKNIYAGELKSETYYKMYATPAEVSEGETVNYAKILNLDSIYNTLDYQKGEQIVSLAGSRVSLIKSDYDYKNYLMSSEDYVIRRHGIEMHKKFTLSFACLLFFFIGAPLGAIIRKGGLGMPVVTSVLLFIFYYTVDNTGYKLARDGGVEIWEGMWLSSAVLLLLGIFLTYKASRDSALFNRDLYLHIFRRLVGQREVRNVTIKEVTFVNVSPRELIHHCNTVDALALEILNQTRPKTFFKYWRMGYHHAQLLHINEAIDNLIEYAQNSRNRLIVSKLMDYPILRTLILYNPIGKSWGVALALLLLPLSFPIYLVGVKQQHTLRMELRLIMKTSDQLIALIQEDIEKNLSKPTTENR